MPGAACYVDVKGFEPEKQKLKAAGAGDKSLLCIGERLPGAAGWDLAFGGWSSAAC